MPDGCRQHQRTAQKGCLRGHLAERKIHPKGRKTGVEHAQKSTLRGRNAAGGSEDAQVPQGQLNRAESDQCQPIPQRNSREIREGGGQKVSQAWVSKDGAMNFSSPVRVGDTLYGLGPSKDLVAVDLPTGNKRWSQEGWFTTSADKAYAGFLVVGGNVLILTDGGTVGLFAADATAFKELGRVQVCGANWCNPAYSDGRLYLRDAKNWQCVVIAE